MTIEIEFETRATNEGYVEMRHRMKGKDWSDWEFIHTKMTLEVSFPIRHGEPLRFSLDK